MNIYILNPSDKQKNYLPFNLYINSLYSILKINFEFNIIIIDKIEEIINTNSNTILFLFLYSFNDDIFNYINRNLITTILINTENYKNFNVTEKIEIMLSNNLNFYIFDYNPINIKYYKNTYPNIKIYYIPLLYNIFLENYYNSNILKKINYNEKDIDIIFFGTINERRNNILQPLKEKYNILIISDIFLLSHSELFNYIERSKIILNIYYYYDNFVFDYYRNSLLLSNKIFLISEYPHNIDLNIETNLEYIENNLILSNYENIINTVDNYLNNYNLDQINNILDNQYNWFKKFDMKDYILNFFYNNII